jgi:uncharacterized membrane protein YGL010W
MLWDRFPGDEETAAAALALPGGVDAPTMTGMFAGRSWESWIAQYSQSHQHPINRLTHTFGIPMILLSLPLFAAGLVWHVMLWTALGLFVAGWTLQFIGHAFEGKPPEFFSDWRFLLVGSRWWLAKVTGKLPDR